ncbi:MAG: hypothetical protein WC444_02970 [Candidatus Paceibacterota bacterium]
MYQNLEPSIVSQITGAAVSPTTQITGSFLATSKFLYTLLFVAIVAAAFYRYALAGIWRMAASEKYVKMSNEEFKRVTVGLLGVFSMFIVIYTFNKDLLNGDVGLAVLKTEGVKGGAMVTGGAAGTGGVAATGAVPAATVQSTLSSLSSGNVCGAATCSALSGCNYTRYLPLLKTAAANNGVDVKMLIVLLCKENRSLDVNADHVNDNQSHDCGLMQINQPGACSGSILDPATNISRGAQLLAGKMGAQTYGNVPAPASVFAAYNCCGTVGMNSNDPSADCNTSTGFTSAIPKWACPINPGPSATNMTFVKNYACEANACLSDPSLNGL